MPQSQSPSEGNALGWKAVLLMAVVLEGYTLYAIQTPSARLSLGVLLLVPVVLCSARIGLVEYLAKQLEVERPMRQFNRLRTQVGQFLSEVKRLNWLAVDFGRGTNEHARIVKEMDAIEERLNQLVRRIREEAGKA